MSASFKISGLVKKCIEQPDDKDIELEIAEMFTYNPNQYQATLKGFIAETCKLKLQPGYAIIIQGKIHFHNGAATFQVTHLVAIRTKRAKNPGPVRFVVNENTVKYGRYNPGVEFGPLRWNSRFENNGTKRSIQWKRHSKSKVLSPTSMK